ncbi:anthranilate synthase component I family protein [Corallococcus praedator]|uniref:Anthranilate synthase component I family protein n=1 Tax=Corallococcus praedator TaxID=2316724 RepID=A0ABX9QLJ6_9BACT|nr:MULTISPECIES: anthranilate synthase component I family protein [Corallococcus]RKH32024.1 anthranilate synthase component I family protein [Corallococcus sp. CA031C]RKI12102.1 anthranilate synthase component I family protein [Corallococcus praedator]
MAVPASPLPPLDRARFDALVAQGYNQVPLVRHLDVGAARPVDLLRALPAGDRFLLESTRTSSEGRYSLVGARPLLRFTARGSRCHVDGVLQEEAPLTVLRGLLSRWKGLRPADLPLFCGGAVGFFSYEASHFFEALPRHPRDDLGVPDIALHFVDTFLVVDHLEHTVRAVATGSDWVDCSRRLDLLASQVRAAVATPSPSPPAADLPLAPWRSNFTQEDYLLAVERVREYIRAGDTYQVNLSQRLEVDFPGDPLALYETLSATSPVHFASYFEADGFQVVSASPERLVRVEDGRATTRPIAGTRRRGTPEEDARFVHELRTSEKEQAEHAMLVDLERNDLGRVCAYGTVEVTRLMEIVEYAHVLHIESEVVGQLAPGVQPLDVVGALFPGGTITGVPKIRTMEIITELEPHPRGLYTGSLGYFSFAGGLDLNIVIRTVVVKDGRAYVQVGGGIVHDSEPRREYKETLNKARSQLLALAASTGPR